MISIYNVISQNTKVIRTSWVQITLDVIKEYIYDNPMYLVLSWW